MAEQETAKERLLREAQREMRRNLPDELAGRPAKRAKRAEEEEAYIEVGRRLAARLLSCSLSVGHLRKSLLPLRCDCRSAASTTLPCPSWRRQAAGRRASW